MGRGVVCSPSYAAWAWTHINTVQGKGFVQLVSVLIFPHPTTARIGADIIATHIIQKTWTGIIQTTGIL